MKRIGLIVAAAALPLATSACGSATPSSDSSAANDPPASTSGSGSGSGSHGHAGTKAERVPADLSQAVVSWRLAAGGTPAQKVLTGSAASTLARDLNALSVVPGGMVACPLASGADDITMSFTADGHRWTVEIASCPGIRVTRDSHALPLLGASHRFLADVKALTGRSPVSGPPRTMGGMTPLMAPATGG